MYALLFRTVVSRLDAERVHHATVALLGVSPEVAEHVCDITVLKADRDGVGRRKPDVAEHDGRVALEPPQLRALVRCRRWRQRALVAVRGRDAPAY